MKLRTGLFILVSALLLSSGSFAQDKFYTKSGKVSFFSSAPIEDITALNKSAVCLLNAKTGDIQFAVLIKGFEFKKALMQEHFNAEYLESDTYPKATFNGQVTNNSAVNYSANGSYPATVKGKMTIHGVSKDIETSGTIEVKDGKPTVKASLTVTLDDYKVTVPRMYRDNISPTIKVSVDCTLDAMK